MRITVKPVETADEATQALDLMARAHAPEAGPSRTWLYDQSERYPGFQREHTRVVRLEREVAAALRITSDTLMLGEARLKMGGIGWVATAEHHRRKGLCRRLMEDALDYLRRHHYHVAMLFGIPDFYHRFGFVTTLADYSVVLDTVEALGPQTRLRSDTARAGEVPTLQKLHAAVNGNIPCSIVRTTPHLWNRWQLWEQWRVLKDERGRVVAYFIARPRTDADRLRIDDVGLEDPAFCADVVAEAGRLAADQSLAQVSFGLPPVHPLARFLLQYRSVHEEARERNAGGMMAFVDLPETLESLVPEWESRVARSIARDHRTEFTLYVRESGAEPRPIRVRANRGAIDLAAAPGSSKVSLETGDLMHLVTGYRAAEDLIATRRAIVTAEARDLMMAVFPRRTPYVWPFDRF
jgi:predicted acetyltransferase